MGIKVLAVGATAAVLLAPGAAVLGVATLISPAAAGSGSCMWDGQATESLGVSGPVPDSLSATNTNGETVTLNQQQLTRAAAIIATGQSENIPARGQMIAIMTALTESSLRVLSNVGAYPHSDNIPNDGDGSDHDSVGLFQQRPAAGWGTVENLMDPVWSSRAFYGGPSGPNHGSPRGLLDIDGWASMDPGAAAQAVQVSAYPDRYAVNQPIAEMVLATLSGVPLSSELACAQPAGEVPMNLPPGFAADFIKAAASQLGKPTSGVEATSRDPPAAASTAPGSSCTRPTKPPADASGSLTTQATRSTPAKASPGPTSGPVTSSSSAIPVPVARTMSRSTLAETESSMRLGPVTSFATGRSASSQARS